MTRGQIPVEMETVDAGTGKKVKKEITHMTLMPCAPGTCALCGRKHEPAMPHDAQAMYYQYRFYGEHGRWPTWSDAWAHCSPEMQAAWKAAPAIAKVFKALPDGVAAISEPYEVQP